MNRNEKVRLSLDFASGYAFRQGLFLRLYEASLCWFVHHARPLKAMLETTKQGEKLLYGGLPGYTGMNSNGTAEQHFLHGVFSGISR